MKLFPLAKGELEHDIKYSNSLHMTRRMEGSMVCADERRREKLKEVW